MGFAKLQMRAAATAFVLFTCASVLLFLLVRGVGNVAAALPLPAALRVYSPDQTIGALVDIKPVVAFGAGVLLVVALVLIVRSAFLDRAVYMVVSMLTLVVASSLGIVVGFGAYLSISAHRVVIPQGIAPVAIAAIIMLVLSFASLDSLRRSLLLRTLLAPVLVIGAPVLLIFGG